MRFKPSLLILGLPVVSILLSWSFSLLRELVLPWGSGTLVTACALLPELAVWWACYQFLGLRDFGLRLRQNDPGKLSRLLLLVILFYGILVYLIYQSDPSYSRMGLPPPGRTIDLFTGKFFEILLIPVLWEEITFHGLLQGYLQRLWPRPIPVGRSKPRFWDDAPVVVSAFAFSSIHLALLLNGEMDRNLATLILEILFLYPVLGFVLGKVRRTSGSILFPVLIHAAYNTLVNFPNFLG